MEEAKKTEIIKIDSQKETGVAKTGSHGGCCGSSENVEKMEHDQMDKTEKHGGCCGSSENVEKMEHVEMDKTEKHGGCCGSGIEVGGKKVGTKSVLVGGGVVILALLFLTGKGGAILGALPFLLILACPLMHFFMHGGKGHKH